MVINIVAALMPDPLVEMIADSSLAFSDKLFSLEQDQKHRERIAAERRRIIAKILALPPQKEDREKGDAQAQERWWVQRFQAAACGECGGGR